jgi:hypothetical protein
MRTKQLIPLLEASKHGHAKTYLDWVNSVLLAQEQVRKDKKKVSMRLWQQKKKVFIGPVREGSEVMRSEMTQVAILGCKINQKTLAAHHYMLRQHEKVINSRCTQFLYDEAVLQDRLAGEVEPYCVPLEAHLKFVEMLQL